LYRSNAISTLIPLADNLKTMFNDRSGQGFERFCRGFIRLLRWARPGRLQPYHKQTLKFEKSKMIGKPKYEVSVDYDMNYCLSEIIKFKRDDLFQLIIHSIKSTSSAFDCINFEPLKEGRMLVELFEFKSSCNSSTTSISGKVVLSKLKKLQLPVESNDIEYHLIFFCCANSVKYLDAYCSQSVQEEEDDKNTSDVLFLRDSPDNLNGVISGLQSIKNIPEANPKSKEKKENKAAKNEDWEKNLDEFIKNCGRKDITVRFVSNDRLKSIIGPSFSQLLDYYRQNTPTTNAAELKTNL